MIVIVILAVAAGAAMEAGLTMFRSWWFRREMIRMAAEQTGMDPRGRWTVVHLIRHRQGGDTFPSEGKAERDEDDK